MPTEYKHTDGELFDMICDHICPIFIERDQIREMSARTNDIGETWVLVYTNLGKTILVEEHQLRKYRLEYLINKLQNNG